MTIEQRVSELETQVLREAVVPRYSERLALLEQLLSHRQPELLVSAWQEATRARDLLEVVCYCQQRPDWSQTALEAHSKKSVVASTSLQLA